MTPRSPTSRLLAPALLSLALLPTIDAATLPSFPGAEGHGALSVGGRGGRVLAVTSLADDGSVGTLRWALTQTGPRIVVFRVGGTIFLNSRITIQGSERSNLTIAGQTAPGDGIQVTRWDLAFAYGVRDVIVRGMRLRPGHTAAANDSKQGIVLFSDDASRPVERVMVDRCSVYWGPDDNLLLWGFVRDVSMQWNISEGMEHDFRPTNPRYEASKACLIGYEEGQAQALGKVSLHHNLFVNCDQRSPMVAGDGPIEVVSNLVVNYGTFGCSVWNRGSGTKINLIGNRFIPGVTTNRSRYPIGMDPSTLPSGAILLNPDNYLYVRDNLGPFRETTTADEWAIVGSGYDPSAYWIRQADRRYQKASPWPDAAVPTTASSATTLRDLITATVGANAPIRDGLDQRAISDAYSGNGIIRRAKDWSDSWLPALPSSTAAPADRDGDGMPDAWEQARGLDPDRAADGAEATATGYTWVEVYLNALLGDPLRPNQPPTAVATDPTVTALAGATGADVTLSAAGSRDGDGSIIRYVWSWNGGRAFGATPTIRLPIGTTVVTLTTVDDQGAISQGSSTVTVRAATSGGAPTGLSARFDDVIDLLHPVVARIDQGLSFDWSTGSPATGIPVDRFSARWDGSLTIPTAGDWRIGATADDGVRIWIDGTRTVDAWRDQPPTDASAVSNLTAGRHTIRIDYYENSGGAVAKLWWEGPGTARQPIPAASLAPAWPAGWFASDIGNVGIAGSSVQAADGTWTVRGSGFDIWLSGDGCHLVGQPIDGDAVLTARITGQDRTDAWAKAGVMLRESLAPGARHISLLRTPDFGLAFQRRLTANGDSLHTSGPTPTLPAWLQIERAGDRITTRWSSDGQTWVVVGNETLVLPRTLVIGLAVSAHNNTVLGRATFTNVTVTRGPRAAN